MPRRWTVPAPAHLPNWHRQVPELAIHEGAHLSGTLKRSRSGEESPVTLAPLAGGQPGWIPRFPEGGDQARVWAHGEGGSYELRLNAVGGTSQ
jgi:hypothetical protein